MPHSFEFKFTGNIHVHSMDRQAGIFIGERNSAVGWSAHGKANNVIGGISGKSNLLYENVLILNDPDLIDTPIDDRDIHMSIENEGKEKTSNFTVESVIVNSMQQNSLVSVGEGHVTGMDANEKSNEPHGSIYGNGNISLGNYNINNDQDVLDAIMEDQDIKIANVNKVE
ncbi:hypothetical protein [Neobacillus mesonae]|uniref:Uncharacterized protein n=1 Tax=Neobacillus mesonae TaxID=1193713 RepID=A0A3T0I3W8_9BACI|nr:hypothetical protein [Neobacillus mesonae]AZU64049.1 hypothetical protein CHR53_23875 [Neobacillus mesonae]MED4206321.1 hypothetical protein [Neobacillus mesonae]